MYVRASLLLQLARSSLPPFVRARACVCVHFYNLPYPDPKVFGYGDALIVRKAPPTAEGVSGASIAVADYAPAPYTIALYTQEICMCGIVCRVCM